MERTPEAIEAEIEALIASGKKNPGKLGKLRKEENESLKAALAASNGPVSASHGPDYDILDSRESDPFDSVEGRFLEGCIQRQEIDFRGVKTSLYKNQYQNVVAQMSMWRIFRCEFAKVGPGGEFRPFAELGINPNTGKPVVPKPVAAAPQPAKPKATEGGMPMRDAPSPQQILGMKPKGDDKSTFIDSVKDEVAGDLASRPAPALTESMP